MIAELEWKTRKERIDKKLSSSWNIIKYSPDLNFTSLTNHAVGDRYR